LFYPETLQRQIRETFQKQLHSEIKGLAQSAPKFARQIEYKLGSQPSSGAGLLKAVEDFLKGPADKILPLVVLANPFRDRVYDLLKQRLRSNPSQCVTERTVKNIVNDQRAVALGQALLLPHFAIDGFVGVVDQVRGKAAAGPVLEGDGGWLGRGCRQKPIQAPVDDDNLSCQEVLQAERRLRV